MCEKLLCLLTKGLVFLAASLLVFSYVCSIARLSYFTIVSSCLVVCTLDNLIAKSAACFLICLFTYYFVHHITRITSNL